MPLDTQTLCKYRLERAEEDLLTAENNHQLGFYKAVIAYFNQFFVHTGEFDKTTYKLIDSAYRIREKCDYSDFFIASKEDSAVQLKYAKMFFYTVKTYLQKKESEQENDRKEEISGSSGE